MIKKKNPKQNYLLGNFAHLFACGKEERRELSEESQRLSFSPQAGVSEALGYLRKRPGAESTDLDLRSASACTPAAVQSSPPLL